MIKTLSLIKRRPDLDRDAFREHYESVHAPLALPHMTGLVRYVRYHLEEELVGRVGFDVLSAFWYQDAESTSKMVALLESEAGRAIREDELTFMDKPENRFFPVSERPLAQAEEGDAHLWILVRKPEEISRLDCSTHFVRDHWPELRRGLGEVEFALLRDAFPIRGAELPYHAVLQLRVDGERGLDPWAAGLMAEGYAVTAVRTRRFESELADR